MLRPLHNGVAFLPAYATSITIFTAGFMLEAKESRIRE
jgi:hypothetical protein